MSKSQSLKLYFVLGEESGDLLGANIIDAFEELDCNIDMHGLAGRRMQERGIASFFDISELSVMGITGVVSKLPTLLKLINRTANDIIEKEPDVLLLIDSPDFAYRVAKKVRKSRPHIKIVKFVAPSVWAWRPGRAKKIKQYVDHILAILPFEVDLMEELDGPKTTYVGHPLSSNMPDIKSADKKRPGAPVNLLILPGSRKGEIRSLLPVIHSTLVKLHEISDLEFNIDLPAVNKLEPEIREAVSNWPFKINIIQNDDDKKIAMEKADVALCASGTVTLELATYKIPMISIYKLDKAMMAIRHIITAWTAALPNLIADYPFIPERMNEYANPQNIARLLARLCVESPERDSQLVGFDLVEERIRQDEAAHVLAAKKILEISSK